MDIYHEVIPDGSYKLWGVPKGADPQAGYKLRVNLNRTGKDTAEVSGAIGDLDHETIINIRLKAIELGFTELTLHAVKGTHVTELVTHLHSDDHFDYYHAVLPEIVARLGIERAL